MLSLGYSIGISMPAPASHSQPQPVITARGNPAYGSTVGRKTVTKSGYPRVPLFR